MTSTGNCVGMETVAKPTSRVLAPPGGKTNIALGGYGEDTASATKRQTKEEVEEEKLQAQKQAQKELYKPSPPQPIRPAVGNNPVTGEPNRAGPPEPASEPAPEPASDQEPSPSGRRAKPPKLDPASMPAAGGRVENKAPIKRQPPGGKDSGIFG
ncbi:alpha carbonic anhydrase 8-like isoform X2 [Patiria miniata]|uniref:Microtubule-associated protein Jupiter n=1 Tax=Patiria miniata TaxID=46514 RepID=A0A913ZWT0_PATMI|nr:alpha carbonic anhydrase 8-like isoform X2 [Patiria miniata]